MSARLAYSVLEAAATTGLSKSTIERAINSGQLPCRTTSTDAEGNPTGKRVILHADLESWLDRLPAA